MLRQRPLALCHELGALAEAVPLHHVPEHTLGVLQLVQYRRLEGVPPDARVVLSRGRAPLPPRIVAFQRSSRSILPCAPNLLACAPSSLPSFKLPDLLPHSPTNSLSRFLFHSTRARTQSLGAGMRTVRGGM